MFSRVPRGKSSLRAAYQAWCESQTPMKRVRPSMNPKVDPAAISVGILGAGMAGLYAALILRSLGIRVHLFEANPARIGGRVYTYRFDSSQNQYFEAGAMRLPDIPEQKPVFDLIDYLNEQVAAEHRIETIPYVLQDDAGNLVYVNGTRMPDGGIMTVQYADSHPGALGFPLPPPDAGKTAQSLLHEAIGPFLEKLQENFEAGFKEIVKYDDFSMRTYLVVMAGWSEAKINYAEVMTSQTNQFQNSFTELVIENMDFSTAQWKTIENGMERLPNACAEVIGQENITMGASVQKIAETEDQRVAVWHSGSAEAQIFDKVIAAVPPAVLRMWETPRWPVEKEHAIRAIHFEPLYKIGLRFRTRFWERVSPPSLGGQSITDLPSRWFVYPSYGLHEDGPGVLLLYSWMTDAARWLPESDAERVRIALRDLTEVYAPGIDVNTEFIEAFEVPWPVKWATGDAMFFPGQFKNFFNIAREPEGNIYFAGEHLSVHHTWIVGALDSALLACKQLLGANDLAPLRATTAPRWEPHSYDYSKCL